MLVVLAISLMICSRHSSAQNADQTAGEEVRIVESGEKLAVGTKVIDDWVRRSAAAVTLYYGRFPIPKVDIVIVGREGTGVHGGRTEPSDPVSVSVFVGANSTADDLMHKDWVLVHEMIHTGLPWLPRRNSWFHEGVAVYVESVARVQAGHLTQEIVLRDFVRQMPRGQSDRGGFDTSQSWARTYWGGALFCLVADVAINRETSNKYGLQDALRAINKSGNYSSEGKLDDLLAIGDKATGTTILTDLRVKYAGAPMAIDLDALWASLGVKVGPDGTVTLDESAPEAPIRDAIFSPRPSN